MPIGCLAFVAHFCTRKVNGSVESVMGNSSWAIRGVAKIRKQVCVESRRRRQNSFLSLQASMSIECAGCDFGPNARRRRGIRGSGVSSKRRCLQDTDWFMFISYVFLADDPRFADRLFDIATVYEPPILLVAQAAHNIGRRDLVMSYSKAALQIHINPIKQLYAHAKLGALGDRQKQK